MPRKKDIRSWADSRRGFKHELVEALVDRRFKYKEAEAIVDSIFESIKQALLRREDVMVEGFGTWKMKPPKQPCVYRLGKIVRLHWRIKFKEDRAAFDIVLNSISSLKRKFHPGWEDSPTRKPQLRGNKLQEHLRKQEEERRKALLKRYVQVICRFFEYNLAGGDWKTVWNLRWTSPPFQREVERTRLKVEHRRNIDEASSVIADAKLPTQQYDPEIPIRARLTNEAIDNMFWYARWTAQLDVEADLWSEAEQLAQGLLLYPSSSPTIVL